MWSINICLADKHIFHFITVFITLLHGTYYAIQQMRLLIFFFELQIVYHMSLYTKTEKEAEMKILWCEILPFIFIKKHVTCFKDTFFLGRMGINPATYYL